MRGRRLYLVSTYRGCGWFRRRNFISLAASAGAAMDEVKGIFPGAIIYCCQELFV